VARDSAVGTPRGSSYYVGDSPRKATCSRPCRMEVKSCCIPATSTWVPRPVLCFRRI